MGPRLPAFKRTKSTFVRDSRKMAPIYQKMDRDRKDTPRLPAFKRTKSTFVRDSRKMAPIYQKMDRDSRKMDRDIPAEQDIPAVDSSASVIFDDNECVACMERPKSNIKHFDCEHTALCNTCATDWMQQDHPTCPSFRAKRPDSAEARRRLLQRLIR